MKLLLHHNPNQKEIQNHLKEIMELCSKEDSVTLNDVRFFHVCGTAHVTFPHDSDSLAFSYSIYTSSGSCEIEYYATEYCGDDFEDETLSFEDWIKGIQPYVEKENLKNKIDGL